MKTDTLRKTVAGLLGGALVLALGSGFAHAQISGTELNGMSRTNAGTGLPNSSAAPNDQSNTNVNAGGATNVGTQPQNVSGTAFDATTMTANGNGTMDANTGMSAGTPNASTLFGFATTSEMAAGTHLGLLSSADLTIGSTGPEVTALQGFLAELGFLDLTGIGGPTGYYGELTRNAVARYQAAMGVVATGYFGPLTRNSMAMHFERNEWLDTTNNEDDPQGSGFAAQDSTLGVGGGTDLSGPFSFTNAGSWFNGVWYPNAVDMSVTAPTLLNDSAETSVDATTNEADTAVDDTSDDTETTDDAMGP